MKMSERSNRSQEFQKRWSEGRSSGKFIPQRSEFDFLAFSEFIPQLVMAEVNLEDKTMPIKFAGTAIRDFVGFELTNMDFTEFDSNPDPAQGWLHRRAYHDCPCGRFELLKFKFERNKTFACQLTILPVVGPNEERQLAVLVEPDEVEKSFGRRAPKMSSETLTFGSYIDIGAGLPQETTRAM